MSCDMRRAGRVPARALGPWIAARIIMISGSCGEITRAPGPRGGVSGPETRRPEEIQKCRRGAANCLGCLVWVNGRSGD